MSKQRRTLTETVEVTAEIEVVIIDPDIIELDGCDRVGCPDDARWVLPVVYFTIGDEVACEVRVRCDTHRYYGSKP